MEDKQFNSCMERMKSGDKQALREIYEAYIGYIYSIVMQVLPSREDAEDVTSEFFIKLWKLADTYEPGNGHRSWMATIARNMAIDLVRKRNRETVVDEFEDYQEENASKDNVENEVIESISLKEALEKLKPNEKEVVNLKIMGELTFQEIASILKIPMGTVTWRYQNAINKLRRCGYE